jgi:hypothetical protein
LEPLLTSNHCSISPNIFVIMVDDVASGVSP